MFTIYLPPSQDDILLSIAIPYHILLAALLICCSAIFFILFIAIALEGEQNNSPVGLPLFLLFLLFLLVVFLFLLIFRNYDGSALGLRIVLFKVDT